MGIGTPAPDTYLGSEHKLAVNGAVNIGTGINVGALSLGGTGVLSTTNSPLTMTLNSGGFTNVVVANGNFGIGETAPGSKLSVSGGATIGASYDTTAAPTNGLIIEGNVGIGTTSPYKAFSVAGNVALNAGAINLDNSTGSQFNYNLSGRTINEGVNSVGQFFVNDATAGTGRLLINTNGNVGIGDYYSPSNLPQNKLSVAGSASIGYATSADVAAPTSGLLVNGNVGIGTTTPASKLEIDVGTTAGEQSALRLTQRGSNVGDAAALEFIAGGTYVSSPAQILGLAPGALDIDLVFRTVNNNATAAEVMRLTGNGNVGIGTTSPWRTLSVAGTVGFDGLTGATGAGSLCLDSNKQVVYNSASDNCLSSTRATKHDIEDLNLDSLSLVTQLNPVSFVYNEGDGRTRFGFIAEDTAAIDPHLATYNASGTVSGIDDRAILSVLVAAIKELAAKLTDLANTIATFAESFTTKELVAAKGTFDSLTTDQLCVGQVCVTQSQFMAVFGAAASAPTDPPPAAQQSQVDSGITTEPVPSSPSNLSEQPHENPSPDLTQTGSDLTNSEQPDTANSTPTPAEPEPANDTTATAAEESTASSPPAAPAPANENAPTPEAANDNPPEASNDNPQPVEDTGTE